MGEFDSGDGGFTGSADGAPYTGYDPGPDQSSVDGPPNPSGLSQDELQRLQEIDKPIEHDPIGQALVSLPVAALTGLGEAAVEGAELGGALLKEGVSWVASEVGIEAGEHVVQGVSEGGSEGLGDAGPGDGGSGDRGSGDAGQPDAGYDPNYYEQGAGHE